jgi:hypothetical protein
MGGKKTRKGMTAETCTYEERGDWLCLLCQGEGRVRAEGKGREMKGEIYSRYPTSSNVPSELEFQSYIFGLNHRISRGSVGETVQFGFRH